MRILPLLFSLLFFISPSFLNAHTIIARPTPRENQVHTNAGPFECGSQRNIANTYTRGQVIPFSWGRNNHYAGFVQASVLPMAQATDIYATATRDAFDNPQNIIHVSCYNQPSCTACQGCSDNFFGLGGDGTDFQQKMCTTSMTIPTYLPDGDYVMKTVVFGNGDSFGVRNMAHSSYSNCHNFRVAGGAALTTRAAGNRHIEWGAGNAGLSDNGITLLNRNRNLNLAQGRCGFMATNTHMGCVPVNGVRAPTCTGPIPALTRCGQAANADTRQECLGNNQENQVQGGDLYNYLLGLPAYHPDYNGQFTLISHKNGGTVRQVALAGGGNTGGGNTGGGNTGGGAATGTCEANGNCRANPGCCAAGKLCYEKDQYYAQCYDINTCTPGVHTTDPAEFRTPWSCLVLGAQTTTGAFGIYRKSNLNRVIDVPSANNVAGTAVWLWENYGPGVAQKFEWVNGEQIKFLSNAWSCLVLGAQTTTGAFGIYRKSNLNRVIDVPSANNVAGTAVWLWENYGPGVAQKFEWVNGEQIRWQGTDKCLDVNGGVDQDGTAVIIWTCDANNANQKFAKVGDTIQWKNRDKCFDLTAAAGAAAGSDTLGTPLQIRTCNAASANQQFVLQPLVRSGSAFVNSKAINSAAALMTPVQKSLSWLQGSSVIDNADGNVTSFIIVPIGSVVDFVGASSTNIVKRVCLELFEKGGDTNPCSLDESVSVLKEANGKVSFWTVTEGDYYFAGGNSTFTSTTQRVQITFVQALSSPEIADALNKGDADGDGEIDPTTNPPRRTYTPRASDASSLQSGFLALISVAVAFFFMKF